MKIYVIIIMLCSFLCSQEFNIARVQYGGGGDWYCDPSSLPNLLEFLKTNTSMTKASKEVRINPVSYTHLTLTTICSV